MLPNQHHHHHQDESDALSDHEDAATGEQSTGGVDPDEESAACYSADY